MIPLQLSWSLCSCHDPKEAAWQKEINYTVISHQSQHNSTSGPQENRWADSTWCNTLLRDVKVKKMSRSDRSQGLHICSTTRYLPSWQREYRTFTIFKLASGLVSRSAFLQRPSDVFMCGEIIFINLMNWLPHNQHRIYVSNKLSYINRHQISQRRSNNVK